MALRFLHSQLFVTPLIPTTSFKGQTIIVTGSNTGLGLEAAHHFVRLGAATVVLAVRSIEKGNAAKASIEARTGREDVVKVMHVDMSSYASVLNFADTASKDLKRIDVALLNAGVNRGKWEVAEEHESTITVNVLSTFLLAFALLPNLIATSTRFNTKPTLTIVASEVHQWADFPERTAPTGQILSSLSREIVNGKPTDLGNRYQLSKLLQILVISHLTSLHPDLPVTINTANPGLCWSDLSRESGWGMYVLQLLLARKAEVGSRCLVHAANKGHGSYVSDGVEAQVGEWVGSDEGKETAQRVWEEVQSVLEGVRMGITKV
jgi:NAD(P)-dependent dehydrogenase (short-subunit alcohol dehydrogenase family)